MTRFPVYFISHGGGPWPWMADQTGDTYAVLAASLREMSERVGQPRVILMISAHWEEETFSVTGHPEPPMIYDYGGFPAHTYQIRYPAPGDPAFADRLCKRLLAAGIPARRDMSRGFDHGNYSPETEFMGGITVSSYCFGGC